MISSGRIIPLREDDMCINSLPLYPMMTAIFKMMLHSKNRLDFILLWSILLIPHTFGKNKDKYLDIFGGLYWGYVS